MVSHNNTEELNVPITDINGRLYSPSAYRNSSVIIELITKFIPNSGKALEIASGTGQHIIQLGSKFKDIIWQPSDLDKERIKSINYWLSDNYTKNIKSPCHLNATKEGWSRKFPNQNFILIINLLHLISLKDTKVKITRLAKGVPVGGEIEFLDDGTLFSAFKNRSPINDD